MLFKPVNIREALIRERGQATEKANQLLAEAEFILERAGIKDKQVLDRLKKPNYEPPASVPLFKYDSARLFSKGEIQRICSRYRLRFLDSSYFKPEFPYEAIAEVKRLEQQNNLSLSKFKMIAPPGLFRLEDRCKKDPLLFAQLNENSFYLLHQWGSDLAWYRALLMWPLKNVYTFAKTVAFISLLLTFIVPLDWIIRNETNPEQIVYFRIAFFIHTLVFFAGFSLFLGLTFRKNFSEQEWNNECFN